MTKKRVFVLSLSHGEPMTMLAGYVDGQLHVIECKRLPRNLSELKKTLPEKLESLRQKGFIVLVDEVLPVFGKYGRSVRLSDEGSDGRPVLVSALETYRSMKGLQAITLPSAGAGTFDISDSIVEQQRDAKGRVTYNIDWSELRTEAALLLLTVNGATQESLFDKPTATILIESMGGLKAKSDPAHPFHAITRGYDRDFLSSAALERRR